MRLAATALVVLLAAPLAANEVSIAFSHPMSEAATIELRRVGNVADLAKAPTVAREASLQSPIVLDLPPGIWAVDVRGSHVWHAQQTFTVSAGHTDVIAKVWPAAILGGRMVVEGSKGPVTLRATFGPSGGGVSPVGTVDCAVTDDVFQCTLPAEPLDIRLRVRGYVTKFYWNQPLATGNPVKLGMLRFVPGATLVGRVEIARDAPVTLKDVIVSASPANADEAAKKVITAAKVESRGLFHVDGLPPGKYDVTATAGKLRARTVSIVVLSGLTAEMRDVLSIQMPKAVTVTVTPPLDPQGRPWQVTIWQFMSDHHVEPITSSRANISGEWSASRLYSSDYQLTVDAADGSTWYRDVMHLGDGDLAKTVDLEVQKVKATVTLGGKPLHANVTVTHGPSTVSFDTDEEGHWSGVIPAASDDWSADIVSDAPPVRRTVRGVRIKRTDGSGESDLTIALPLNVIMGTVVRKDGQPLDHALIRIGGGESLQTVEMAGDGSFFAAGFAAGTYRVSASSFLLESPAIDVTLLEGSVPDPLRLVLDDSVKIHGQVISDFGAVAGAQVVVSSTDVPQAVSIVNTTDERGEFSATAAPGAKEIDVFVGAPGFALKFFHTHLRDGSLIVPVDQRGGRLTISQTHGAHRPYLIHDGMWYPADALLTSPFAYEEGGQIVIPAIDAGGYLLCLLSNDEANAARHGVMLQRPCQSAFLAPYGSLAMDSASAP